MKINNISLSAQDTREAVELFLKSKGIIVPIESVDKNYSRRDLWEVVVADPVEEQPAVKPEQKPPTV